MHIYAPCFLFSSFSSSSTCQSLELILGCTPAPGCFFTAHFLEKEKGHYQIVPPIPWCKTKNPWVCSSCFWWDSALRFSWNKRFRYQFKVRVYAMKKLKNLVEWISWIHRKHTKSRKFGSCKSSFSHLIQVDLLVLFCCVVDFCFLHVWKWCLMIFIKISYT